MQVSVSHSDGLERRLTVTLPAQQIEQELTKRLSKLRKTAKLPGFRPGKIPASVIDKKFGSEVLHEVAGEMINRSCLEALAEQKIEPATRPNIEPKDIARGQDIEYTVTFDVFPEVNKPDLSGVNVEKPISEILDEDIDNTIETIRKQNIKWNTVEESAKQGDQVKIDFNGTINGEAFEGGQAKDYQVVIGEGMLLKDFEQALVGMTIGQTRTVDVEFPTDYPAQKLAGNTAQFEITVHEVAQPDIPELNEAFFKSLGIEDGTEQSFRDQVKENMQRELNNRLREMIRENVFKAITECNELDLPEQLVNDEVEHIKQVNQQQIKHQGLDASKIKIDDNEVRKEASRRVKLSLIVRGIITANELKLDKQMIDARLDEMAQSYEDKDAFIGWYTQDKQRMQQLETAALEQIVIDKLLESADVNEKNISFKELMNTERK